MSSKNSELPSSTSRGPRAGEAVGLELEQTVAPVVPARVLDGVPELVGEHDAEGEAAELLVEVGDEVHVVPRDEVGARAVEGVLGDVVVGRAAGCRTAAARCRGRRARSRREIGSYGSP